jgi:hypothetical protein
LFTRPLPLTRRHAIARCACIGVIYDLWKGNMSAAGPERWAVYYGPVADETSLISYDLVVLDPDRRPPLKTLVVLGKTALSYLSLTQLSRDRAAFPELLDAGIVGPQHQTWTGAHYVDFRRAEWMQIVLERLVPEALSQGFRGLFLDTLDDADHLEMSDPMRYQGMREAGVRLVRAIRGRFPEALLMVNRGYALMPQLAASIDMLLGESVVGTFDFARKVYQGRSTAEIDWQVTALRSAQAANPRLKLYTLDYWPPSDPDTVRAIYREQRARGFIPYVSTPALDQLFAEPQ